MLSVALFVVATIRQLLPTPEARLHYAGEIARNPVVLLPQGSAHAATTWARAAAQQRGAATTPDEQRR